MRIAILIGLIALAVAALFATAGAQLPVSISVTGVYEDTSAYFMVPVVDGDYIYSTDIYDGLSIVSITDPENPTLTSQVTVYYSGNVTWAVAADFPYVYVGNYPDGLQVVDVTTPASPVTVGACTLPRGAKDLVVQGDYLYAACYDSGMVIVDVSDPSDPTRVGQFSTDYYLWRLAVSGDYAFLAAADSGLQIVDVSNHSSPSLTSTWLPDSGSVADVDASGLYAYVGCYPTGLAILDVSNASSPSLVSTTALSITSGGPRLSYHDNYCFTLTDTTGYVSILNVANRNSPSIVLDTNFQAFAWDIGVAGKRLVVPKSADGALVMACIDFPRGDVTADGVITSADINYLVAYVYQGGPAPLPVWETGDVNCNGSVTSADVTYLVNYVFRSGPPPCTDSMCP